MRSIQEAARDVVSKSDDYAYKLFLSDFWRRPVLARALGSLNIEKGSRGLDAGCGIGTNTLLLAENTGEDGHVTGVDISAKYLSYATDIARRRGLSERVSFVVGSIEKLDFTDGDFDWAVSIDCACYPSDANPAATIEKLSRVVKPGGTVAVLGWSSQRLLPGHAALEARLNVASSLTVHSDTGTELMAGLRFLEEAGLTDCAGSTFAGDMGSPLSEDERAALISLFDMLWGGARGLVTEQDWGSYERLCLEGSPGSILDSGGYYAFFTYTAFQGTVTPA